jgi:hypothetical protein
MIIVIIIIIIIYFPHRLHVFWGPPRLLCNRSKGLFDADEQQWPEADLSLLSSAELGVLISVQPLPIHLHDVVFD